MQNNFYNQQELDELKEARERQRKGDLFSSLAEAGATIGGALSGTEIDPSFYERLKASQAAQTESDMSQIKEGASLRDMAARREADIKLADQRRAEDFDFKREMSDAQINERMRQEMIKERLMQQERMEREHRNQLLSQGMDRTDRTDNKKDDPDNFDVKTRRFLNEAFAGETSNPVYREAIKELGQFKTAANISERINKIIEDAKKEGIDSEFKLGKLRSDVSNEIRTYVESVQRLRPVGEDILGQIGSFVADLTTTPDQMKDAATNIVMNLGGQTPILRGLNAEPNWTPSWRRDPLDNLKVVSSEIKPEGMRFDPETLKAMTERGHVQIRMTTGADKGRIFMVPPEAVPSALSEGGVVVK